MVVQNSPQLLLFSVTIPRAKRQAEVTTLAPESITTNPEDGGEEEATDAPIVDGGDGEEVVDPTEEGEDGETLTVNYLIKVNKSENLLGYVSSRGL